MRFIRSTFLGLAALAVGIASVSFPAVVHATTVGFGTYNLTQSNAFGTGLFGTVTVADIGGGAAGVTVNVSPNFILDTGGSAHWAGTFSLAGLGAVDANAFGAGQAFSSSHFSLVTAGGPFQNSPFGDFTSAIAADCNQGNCGPTLGDTYSFHILNFAGLVTATNLFNGLAIVFAVDISRFGCTGDGCTGAVGAAIGGDNANNPLPLPPAVLLFGSALVGLTILGRRRRSA